MWRWRGRDNADVQPDIYAAGDLTGGSMYVYVAAAGGRVAAENAVKSLAPTGTSSGRATRDKDIQVSTFDMSQVPRAIVSYSTGGMLKIVAEAASGRILGVHAAAPHAGDMMGEATLAVRFGLTTRDRPVCPPGPARRRGGVRYLRRR